MKVRVEFNNGNYDDVEAFGFTEVAIHLTSRGIYLWDIKSITVLDNEVSFKSVRR
jgi:nitrous oxidase accessory protein NosD